MLGQPPLAVLPPGKISYTCRIAPHIIINYRCARTGGDSSVHLHSPLLSTQTTGSMHVRLTTTELHSSPLTYVVSTHFNNALMGQTI